MLLQFGRRVISTCLVVTFRSQNKEETRLVEFTWAGVEIEGGGVAGTLLYMHRGRTTRAE